MPTVIRKSAKAAILESHREILHAVSWQIRSTTWSPPTDQYETEETYVVRMEIAGMQEDDFEVSLENNILHISGERLDPPERRAYQQMEIRFGKFASAVRLPGPVSIDQTYAEYKNGFLIVVLPKDNSDKVE
ncbi:MAG: Hsp20/alpha crystallin family protein [Chloroflexi bacterium]|jgi:HSP20 family protein|nr:Hsp20/alpha crystallin family protein [Chloroflexota bacterium]